MQCHLWLAIVTVALFATVIYAEESKIPMADDPRFNKMLPIRILADSKENSDSPPASKVPSVDESSYDTQSKIPKSAKTLTNSTRVPILAKDTTKVKKLTDINENEINSLDNKTKSLSDDDDYYGDDYYYDDDDDDDDIINSTTPIYVPSTNAPIEKNADAASKLKPIDLKNDVSKNGEFIYDQKNNDIEDDDDDDGEEESSDSESAESGESKTMNKNCPRDCICSRNLNGYLVATCNRLDAGIQKFSSDITDLEVSNVTPQFPIVIGSGFFKNIGLEHVSSIKIVNTFIENIHPMAFEGLDDLYSVNLTNSGITQLHPDTFAMNKKLRILTLDANDLSLMQQNVSPFIDYMLKAPSVEELYLARCNLKKLLPTAFNRLENVVFINLANNNLQSLPPGIFYHVETIEELDLSSNNITNLPKNIFNRTSLAILNLKYNHIESKLDFATPEIQKLDLSYNNISSVSNNMFSEMTGLTSLILKGNGIKKIHLTAFFALKGLRQIDLSFNDLEQVSSLIFLGNQELDVIRLNDNYRLKTLPLEGFACEKEKFNVYLFDLANCDISELGDDTFKNMPRLTTLNLAWNNIETLTKEFFKDMNKLIELNLSNNEITELSNLTFLYNRNLKKLNLAGNPLQKISPRMFLPLKDLAELDLSSCDLAEIWSEPMSSNLPVSTVLKNLKLLNISNNDIVHARHTHFSSMEHLEVLDLSNNHLHCDDGFKALMQWLVKRKIKAGNVHVGFNAELKDNGAVVESRDLYSWGAFENQTCSQAHQMAHIDEIPNKIDTVSDEMAADDEDDVDEIDDVTTDNGKQNGNVIDNVDGVDDSDSEDDDDDDDDYDDENEIEIDSGKELKNKESLIDEEIDVLNNRIIDLEGEVLNDRESKILLGQYRYMIPIMIVLFSILTMMVLIGKLVSVLMRRRGERYRQALLASKNSIIYQKLSEEIGTPQTPKFHRYSPINQV